MRRVTPFSTRRAKRSMRRRTSEGAGARREGQNGVASRVQGLRGRPTPRRTGSEHDEGDADARARAYAEGIGPRQGIAEDCLEDEARDGERARRLTRP